MKNDSDKKTNLGLTLLAILLIIPSLSYGQSFQGTLTYVQDVEVPKAFIDMGITKEVLLEKMIKDGSWCDTMRISYKQGDYYSVMNNSKQSFTIYKAETNKIYTFAEGIQSDVCTVQEAVDLDLSGSPDKPDLIQPDTTVTINGVKCSVVIVQWKLGRIDYYYNSSQLEIDPKLFSKHTSDAWSEFLKMSKSLPLRVIKNVFGMRIIQTLVTSKSGEVKADLFRIPALVPDDALNVFKMPNTEVMRIKK